MQFNEDSYTYEVAKKKMLITGHYTYQLLDKDNAVALITCQETYNGKETNYNLLLNALDEQSGSYIYKQYQGAISPQYRMNFGYYAWK